MTLAEYYNRQIPEYYDTMYLDGYTHYQILEAASNKIYSDHLARKQEAERDTIIPTINFKSTVRVIK